MMTYTFDNKKKTSDSIVKKLSDMFDFTVRLVDSSDFLLSNKDMVINVGKKTTGIILYNLDLNISEIRKYFMEK